MATNIPPEAAQALDGARSISEPKKKIKALKEAISLIPKHKDTEKFIGNLRKRISKLKEEVKKRKKAKKAGKKGIRKRGAAQVCLIGKQNSGKTYLLNQLTNKEARSTPVPFETQKVQIGMMDYGGVKIQVLDMPSITSDFYYKEDGPYFMNLVRNTDLVVLTFKDNEPVEDQLKFLKQEFSEERIIFGKKEPKVKIKRTDRGEINFVGEQCLKGDPEEYRRVLRRHNHESSVVELFSYLEPEDLKRVLENYAYKNALVLRDFKNTKKKIWDSLGLIKVYTKQPNKDKTKQPMALEKGSTVEDAAEEIHKDFLKKFRFAKVWGESADFPGQRIGLDHKLKQGDTIQFHLK